MCSIDLDHCEMWHETGRRARKEHRCSSCGGPIQPNAVYTVHFSVYDGSPTSEKICEPCSDARAEFADEHNGMRPTPGYFPQMLSECIAEGDPESEKRWRPMYAALLKRNRAGRRRPLPEKQKERP